MILPHVNPGYCSTCCHSKIIVELKGITATALTHMQPWQVPTQQNPPVFSYYMQASVYHPSSKKIFYIGGLVNNATTEEIAATRNVSMSEITTFDTATGAWGTQNFTGELIPSPRKSHTVTLCMS